MKNNGEVEVDILCLVRRLGFGKLNSLTMIKIITESLTNDSFTML